MKLPIRPAGWLLIVALCLPGARAAEKWIHAQTSHFEMFSSASEQESRSLLLDLERFRQIFHAILNLPPVREPRCTVIMFGSDRRFTPYKPLYNGEPTEVAGYFVGWADETVIALSADARTEEARRVIFHEYVHLLVHTHGFNLPLWLNEGLAELYSTFTIRKGEAMLGNPIPEHVEILRARQLLSFGELFATGHDSPTYNEGDRQGMFYAQSWALVHFWLCGQKQDIYRPKLGAFMHAIEKPNAMPEACFQSVFGMDYDEMERLLSRYMVSGRYIQRTFDLSSLPPIPAPVFEPAAAAERDLALINLRWRCQQPGDTTLKLLDQAQRTPASPRPYELLAAVAMQDREPVLASDYWRRAIELGSRNAYIYVQAAASQLEAVTRAPSLDYRMPEELSARLRAWLDRAIELSPEYDEAFEYLTAVEAYSARPRGPTVNRIQERFRKMRNKARVLVYFAIMRWRIKDYATARELAEVLTSDDRATPEIKATAAALLSRLPAVEPAEVPAEKTADTADPVGTGT